MYIFGGIFILTAFVVILGSAVLHNVNRAYKNKRIKSFVKLQKQWNSRQEFLENKITIRFSENCRQIAVYTPKYHISTLTENQILTLASFSPSPIKRRMDAGEIDSSSKFFDNSMPSDFKFKPMSLQKCNENRKLEFSTIKKSSRGKGKTFQHQTSLGKKENGQIKTHEIFGMENDLKIADRDGYIAETVSAIDKTDGKGVKDSDEKEARSTKHDSNMIKLDL